VTRQRLGWQVGALVVLAVAGGALGWLLVFPSLPSVPAQVIEDLNSTTVQVVDHDESTNPTSDWLETYVFVRVPDANDERGAVRRVRERLKALGYQLRPNPPGPGLLTAYDEEVDITVLPADSSNVPLAGSGEPMFDIDGGANSLILVVMPLG
jgi:hypothetical protein